MKRKILIVVAITGAVLILISQKDLYSKFIPAASNDSPQPEPVEQTVSVNDKPTIVSTKPDPLEETIVAATDTIEITFNRPLENVGEFKVRIEPEIDYKVELSNDRRTAKIIPIKPYQLGTTYTLFIGTETKFDGIGRWGEEKIYHFRTIKYTGV
ncbi:MAG: Ig-like domain-containing protein [Candidatus Daviesbacteria bacterium]|nr:Ig-like domain-containing protein [Candidatus Daviesbacteria bacterium]